jgi:fused signal recognition particle receptor
MKKAYLRFWQLILQKQKAWQYKNILTRWDNMTLFDKFLGKKNDRISKDEPETKVSEKKKETKEAALKNEPEKKKGFMEKFKKGLSKTRENITGKIDNLVKTSKNLDEEFWEELEEILIQADVGVNTSLELVENIKKSAKKNKINDSSQVIELIRDEIRKLLEYHNVPINISPEKPGIILVVGVNGAGKTTSIGKLAYRYKQQNQKVLLAAADTFRAAAIEQLQVWADRVGADLIKHKEGSDPGAVVYDAIMAAKARDVDVLIIDTAGRLQNKVNLMKEIGKVRNIIQRELPGSSHEVLLVLDATTGQNAISQAKLFKEATGVTGLILSKLDGTAKGGIVLAVTKELEIPVKLVGIGEGIEDLRDFSPGGFAEALFEE